MTVVAAADVVDVFAYLVVIELTALLFGDSVRLGGFVGVTALIICLMTVRAVLRKLVVPSGAAVTV